MYYNNVIAFLSYNIFDVICCLIIQV